jgi:hypothetical protein
VLPKESAIRGICLFFFMLAVCAAHGQQPAVPDNSQPASDASASAELPDSPGQAQQDQQSIVVVAKAAFASDGTKPPLCRTGNWMGHHPPADDPEHSASTSAAPLACVDSLNPYVRFLDTSVPIPMTPRQKGYLAFRDVIDPFNLATIFGSSAISIAADSHSAYGPGFGGFAELSGVSLLQDATGEFFGTFLIPSIAHQDPHYHRMPTASVPRRLLHAVSHTVIAQSDFGHNMPNYAAFFTYPIASEISNLYVPGIESDGPSTVKRIFIGYALDPVNNLIIEFLPDVARRIHVRVIFVQQIINQIAVTSSTSGGPL